VEVKQSLKITIFLNFFICWILWVKLLNLAPQKNQSSTWDHSWIFHNTPHRSTTKRSQLPPHHKKLLLTIYHIIGTWARVNQQSLVEDAAIQVILGVNQKTHSLPLHKDFSAPFSTPIFSLLPTSPPSYLPCTSFTSFLAHSISRARRILELE
jgi:hypothetical protein